MQRLLVLTVLLAYAAADAIQQPTTSSQARSRSGAASFSRLTLPLRVQGSKNFTFGPVTDPFLWHQPPMLSTWVFFGYHGYLDPSAAAMAASTAFSEATYNHAPDRPIGAGTKTWSATYRGGETVDLVLMVPSEAMTWRMLAEGITGAQMVVYERKETNFVVLAEGIEGEVGLGQIKRRGSAGNGGSVLATAVAESSAAAAATLPITPAVRDPGLRA
ncbi:MAG: hypothetical protein Q9208_007986 [Pyrenodesmia sp. 3 TL-2023]